MDMKSLISKMDEMEGASNSPSANLKEAYINSKKDVIDLLGRLRAMGKKGDLGGEVPPEFRSSVVNDLYDVMVWIDRHVQESVTNEAGPADKPEHKDDDQDDKRWDDAEEDKEEVTEGIVVQADGQEAMALLDMLKLAGRPAPVVMSGHGMSESEPVPGKYSGTFYDVTLEPTGDYKIVKITQKIDSRTSKNNPLNLKVGDIVPKGKANMLQHQYDGGMFDVVQAGVAEADRDPSYSNTPGEKTSSMDAATPSGDDLHKSKTMTKHGYQQGDNPLAMAEVAEMEGKLAKMFESLSGE